MIAPLVVGGVQSVPLSPDSSTTLEDLTSGIRFYLREMGQHVIEIGKRLILAKALVPHGEWQSWLEDNFNFSQRTARQFMQIAERFGEKSDSQKWQTSAVLNQSQMAEMLLLPEGEEENFFEEQAAEGRIVAEMSVKMLRVEIQKYKAKLATVSGVVEDSSVKQETAVSEKVEEFVQSEDVSSEELFEETVSVEIGSENFVDMGVIAESVSMSSVGNDNQGIVQNSLEQFFGMMKALASGGNLQELVEQSAEKDLQAFEGELRQFAALYGDIQGFFAQWKRSKDMQVDSAAYETSVVEDVEIVDEKTVVAETDVKAPIVEDTAGTVAIDKGGDNENSLEVIVENICDKKDVDESDRHSILSALYQIALNDDENFTRTGYIRSLVVDMGFEVVHKVPTKDLHHILFVVALKFEIHT